MGGKDVDALIVEEDTERTYLDQIFPTNTDSATWRRS